MAEEIKDTIERHARSTVGTTVFDMFVYYAPPLHAQSTIDRLNCIGLSEKLTEKIRLDSNLKDVDVSIIPFDSDHYTPEQFAKYPYGHAAIMTQRAGKTLGVVDPAYGIFIPIWAGDTALGNGWEFYIKQDKGESYLRGEKGPKNFEWKFYPQINMNDQERDEFQRIRTKFQHTAHSYILSNKDASKITRIEMDVNQVRYKDSYGQEKSAMINNDPADFAVEKILSDYVSEVNGILVPQGRKLDFSEFYEGVTAFWNTVKSIPRHSTHK